MTEKDIPAPNPTDDQSNEINAQRVFELYVDQLTGDVATLDEILVVRLRWFAEDIEQAQQRLQIEPGSAVEIVKKLSGIMQDLDAKAGEAKASHGHLAQARRWALLIPETVVHS